MRMQTFEILATNYAPLRHFFFFLTPAHTYGVYTIVLVASRSSSSSSHIFLNLTLSHAARLRLHILRLCTTGISVREPRFSFCLVRSFAEQTSDDKSTRCVWIWHREYIWKCGSSVMAHLRASPEHRRQSYSALPASSLPRSFFFLSRLRAPRLSLSRSVFLGSRPSISFGLHLDFPSPSPAMPARKSAPPVIPKNHLSSPRLEYIFSHSHRSEPRVGRALNTTRSVLPS